MSENKWKIIVFLWKNYENQIRWADVHFGFSLQLFKTAKSF